MIHTSLALAVSQIAGGHEREEETFVVETLYIPNRMRLEEAMTQFSMGRWRILTDKQVEKLMKIANEQGDIAYQMYREEMVKENIELYKEICCRLVADGKVFQPALVQHRNTASGFDPEIWMEHKYCGVHLRVGDAKPWEFANVQEFVEWQRMFGYGKWIDYMFPEGLTSVEQLKAIAQRIG